MKDDASHRGGFTIREYEARVWDMARHQIHPTALYVAAQVAGATRLLGHPVYADVGGSLREIALFGAGFVGAWACFYSTLLRVAGLRSLAVTFLVPLAAAAALALWFVVPPPDRLSRAEVAWCELALAGPGVVGFAFTMMRWRAARREAAAESERGSS